MSRPTEAVAVVARPTTVRSTASLRNLYVARFAFAIAWAAGLLATDPSDLGLVTGTLLVIYPLVDAGAAGLDLRSSGARQRVPLLLNVALGSAAAIGLGVAAASGTPEVLRVWGAWAITAGILQLIVAARRSRLAGQLPMILSGGISVLAGGSFVAMASGDHPSLGSLAGYATLGGLFFAASAYRLHRGSATSDR